MFLEEQQSVGSEADAASSSESIQGGADAAENQSSFSIDSAAEGLANDLFGQRDESGEGDGQEAEEEVAPEKAEKKSEPKPEPEVKAQSKPAPASWAKERHEAWAKLDSETQDYIALREKQMFDGVQKQAADAKLGREINQSVQPYMETLKAQGVDAQKAISWMMNNHQVLSTAKPHEKAYHLMDLARRYGVDLSLAGVNISKGAQSEQLDQQGQQEGAKPYDPVVGELMQRINAMEAAAAQREEAIKKAENERLIESASKELEAFASAPENKFFDEVADDMVLFIENGFPLKEAYDRAVRANPDTYQKLIAEASTAQEKAIKDKIKQGANTAKTLTRNNLNQRNTGKAPTGPTGSLKDLDKLLSNAYDEMKQSSNNY